MTRSTLGAESTSPEHRAAAAIPLGRSLALPDAAPRTVTDSTRTYFSRASARLTTDGGSDAAEGGQDMKSRRGSCKSIVPGFAS